MSKPQLKVQKLPDTKPVKHTISVMPDLEADLEAYAKDFSVGFQISFQVRHHRNCVLNLSLIHI